MTLLMFASAAAPGSDQPRVEAVGHVSVEIIRADPIFVLSPPKGERPVDRQISRRDNVPTVDFY